MVVAPSHTTQAALPGSARRPGPRRPWVGVAGWAAAAVFVIGGAAGAGRYVWTFWRYRGFAPPSTPASVVDRAGATVTVAPVRTETIAVDSPALGGRPDQVLVVLPPGYDTHPHRRYPVLYLLHGVPGQAQDFLTIGDAGSVEATLVAEHRTRPTILVIPAGAGFLTDTEWADGVRPGNGWETFVARDLVSAVDARYRTIASASGRALAGLSEGGYGALNIGLHHLGEFGVLESWSGYMQAPAVPSVFGRDPAVLAANSPALTVRSAAAELRRARTMIWFYCGTTDYTVAGNRQFADELSALGVPHTFGLEPGSHNWKLWRTMFPAALQVAAEGGRE